MTDTKEMAQGYENIKTAFDAFREKNKDYKDENKCRIMNPLSRLFFAFNIYTFGSLLS